MGQKSTSTDELTSPLILLQTLGQIYIQRDFSQLYQNIRDQGIDSDNCSRSRFDKAYSEERVSIHNLNLKSEKGLDPDLTLNDQYCFLVSRVGFKNMFVFA